MRMAMGTLRRYIPEDGARDVEESINACSIRLNVIRCLLSTHSDEDWYRSSVFHTYIKHNDKYYKVMIDGGSCVNIIVKLVVDRMNLKAEPHSQSYNVT